MFELSDIIDTNFHYLHNFNDIFDDRRLSEYESQNRELLAISSKKEEIIRQLQLREEKHIEEVASLNRQLDTTRVDTRKQLEEYKEKSSSKDRSQQARLADLEAQQGRLSSQNSQLRKSKEEVCFQLQYLHYLYHF